jgi:5'(3')-deoxyribonucleotidase
MIPGFSRVMNTVFIDMDRVLVDYDKFIAEKFGHLFQDKKIDDAEIVDHLHTVDHLYLNLPPMPYAQRLVRLAMLYSDDVQILTSLPSRWNIEHAEEDKREWIARHFPSQKLKCNICQSPREKWEWAKRGDILIDDKLSNILSWEELGYGNGIHHNPRDYALTATRFIFLVSESL